MLKLKNVLYLGIEKPFKEYPKEINLIHYPIIKIIPRSKISYHDSFSHFLNFTHIIFTSKTAVHLFFEYLADYSFSQDDMRNKQYIVVGKATAHKLKEMGIDHGIVAQNETAEGVVDLLKTLPLKNCFIFWPHSSLSRNVLPQFFIEKSLRFESCILYDTVPHLIEPRPDLTLVDEIIFTSPSTVDAFLTFYPNIPSNKILTPIGPITKTRLEKRLLI